MKSWSLSAVLLAVLICPGAVQAQNPVTDHLEKLHALLAPCDAKHTACERSCQTGPECGACEKEWLDCRAKLTVDLHALNVLRRPRDENGQPSSYWKQSTRAHIVDGCSVPGWLGGQNPCEGVKWNDAPTDFGVPQGDAEDNVLQEGEEAAKLPCNQHDICYQTCGSSRSRCDQQMYDDMMGVCDKAYAPAGCPFQGDPAKKPCPVLNDDGCNGVCTEWYGERELCAKSAEKYKDGLDWLGGPAFRQRQWQYCEWAGGS